MIKFNFIILFTLLIYQPIVAQGLFKLYPYQDSAAFFAKTVKSRLNKDSYYYAIILNPASCPRCEAIINLLSNKLVEKGLTPPDIWITDSRFNSSIAYLKKRGFIFSKVLFFENVLEYFYLNTGTVNVPIAIKLNPKGELISYEAFLGKENFDNFFQSEKAIKPKKKIKPKIAAVSSTAPQLKPFNKTKIFEDSINFLGVIEKAEKNGSLLLIGDFSNNSYIPVYQINTGSFLRKIEIDSALRMSYIKLNQEKLEWAKKNAGINYSINLFVVEQDSVFFSLSLPSLEMNGNLLSIRNLPCICRASLNDSLIKDCKVLDEIYSQYAALSADHTRFILSKDSYIFAVEKGVPVIGSSIADTVMGQNPFDKNFYADAPLFHVYDSELNFVRKIGSLDSFAIANRLGYALNQHIMKRDNDKIILSDGYSGTFYVFDESLASMDVLKLPTRNPIEKRFKYKTDIDYILSMDKVINYYTIDIKLDKQSICTLSRYNPDGMFGDKANSLYLLDIFEGQKLLKTYTIPNIYEGMSLSSVHFSKKSEIVAIYQNIYQTFLVEYKF